jgi:hypothetical protein
VRVPGAGARGERLLFALSNGLDQAILPDYAGASLSRTPGGLALNFRGFTCGTGVVRFHRALAAGEQRLVGEPYYVGGVLPLTAGEHVYRFLYRVGANEGACFEGNCFLKRVYYRVTARFSVQ